MCTHVKKSHNVKGAVSSSWSVGNPLLTCCQDAQISSRGEGGAPAHKHKVQLDSETFDNDLFTTC